MFKIRIKSVILCATELSVFIGFCRSMTTSLNTSIRLNISFSRSQLKYKKLRQKKISVNLHSGPFRLELTDVHTCCKIPLLQPKCLKQNITNVRQSCLKRQPNLVVQLGTIFGSVDVKIFNKHNCLKKTFKMTYQPMTFMLNNSNVFFHLQTPTIV